MKEKNICIGCQACVEICPCHAIEFSYSDWGEGRACIDMKKCVQCGKCQQICPSKNIIFNTPASTVYAAFSKKNQNTGSSGGIFFELANNFISQGGIVYGAVFNSDLKLVHARATDVSKLTKMCKSKYLHSDMSGIYTDISEMLKKNIKVMFVGTPCQVSAVKNLFWPKYKERIFLVDFLCHGTGTQKVFDMCIREEEKRRNGKIIDFVFRAKTRKVEHNFKYILRRENKDKLISGYSFEFPYYNSFLKYTIFNEYCYDCKYALNRRVGDITLGDFWGIQKYNKNLNEKDGISMISINTEIGEKYFRQILPKCVAHKYPIEFASNNNQSFRECEGVNCKILKHKLEDVLRIYGTNALIESLRSDILIKQLIYVNTPNFIIKIWHLIRGRK